MDITSYKSLIAKTQKALRIPTEELPSNSFDVLLQNCNTCIKENLVIITGLLSEEDVCIPELIKYLNDAVCLLELLSNFVKTNTESELMTCHALKTFPTAVASIIIDVFSHCKESESSSLYGNNLSNVEQQLKYLFKSCHELQLAYLNALEKHFVFELHNVEDTAILVQALGINLKIGETVPSLDMSSMAVQWKVMVAIFEKYSSVLVNTVIIQDCMSVLCLLIRNNVMKTVELSHATDDKIIIRSLKVANFFLKTLLKTCDIFENSTKKEYQCVISLFFFIYGTNANLVEATERAQFMNFILTPSECLLKKLLYDQKFGNILLNCDIGKIKDERLFVGYILTVTSVMDCLTQGHRNKTVTKAEIINCLYSILPECNSQNLDVTLCENDKSHGLFEHLLIHSLALVLTLNCEEYSLLEKNMVEAILSTDHVSALFSTNIWALLHMARDINPQLLFNQIIWLSTMYKKLENQGMFHGSPQKVHLTHTITRLFGLMENDDKIKICKQFRIHDDDNLSLWAALGVKNLPHEAKNAALTVVAEKLKIQFQSINSNIEPEKIDKTIKLMRVAASCAFPKGSGIEDCIMKAWSKTCVKKSSITHVRGTAWFYDYLQALLALTDAMWHLLSLKNVLLVKLLHYVANIIQQCGVDYKLLFTKILCKLATTDIYESKVDDFTAAFACLYQTSEDIVRYKLFTIMTKFRREHVNKILSNGDQSLRDSWSNFNELTDKSDIKIKYVHKCLDKENETINTLPEECDFDFVDDVDDVFENVSEIEEPKSKKVKLDNNEAESIIKRLEEETSSLRRIKENVFSDECRSRIQRVCDELGSLIN